LNPRECADDYSFIEAMTAKALKTQEGVVELSEVGRMNEDLILTITPKTEAADWTSIELQKTEDRWIYKISLKSGGAYELQTSAAKANSTYRSLSNLLQSSKMGELPGGLLKTCELVHCRQIEGRTDFRSLRKEILPPATLETQYSVSIRHKDSKEAQLQFSLDDSLLARHHQYAKLGGAARPLPHFERDRICVLIENKEVCSSTSTSASSSQSSTLSAGPLSELRGLNTQTPEYKLALERFGTFSRNLHLDIQEALNQIRPIDLARQELIIRKSAESKKD
jgi:hypothetical protein